jgi:DNA-directed RNA polymerase subunit alpha
MVQIKLLETSVNTDKTYSSSFLIEPLEIGQGITLGNTLRRTLLSDLSSFAITSFRLNNLKHEFTTVKGLREDILELILNLRSIIFKPTSFIPLNKSIKLKGFLNVKGPLILTAGLLNLPAKVLTIVNPNQYLGTLVSSVNFYLEFDIENNFGYKLVDAFGDKTNKIISFQKTFFIDANFSPVKKVNYKIKLIYDTKGKIKESLFLEILTNGSITPYRSLQESLKLIFILFGGLLTNNQVDQLSSFLLPSII